MSQGIRRLVLDVLKPHVPTLPELADRLAKLEGVTGVNISLIEVDAETESIKVTIVGNNLNYSLIKKGLEEQGAVIHSVDQVVAGSVVVEEPPTHQL
ncbi:MAG: DUF211 domain-containing protein [Candidatus Odinarchaeia archaeon]